MLARQAKEVTRKRLASAAFQLPEDWTKVVFQREVAGKWRTDTYYKGPNGTPTKRSLKEVQAFMSKKAAK